MEFDGDSPLLFIAGVYDSNPIREKGVCVWHKNTKDQ